MTRPTTGSHDRLLTAEDFPDCEACQMWQDAGASWPRPCFKHYTAEPVAGAAPAYPAVQNYAPIDSLRDRILVAILDQAPTMEQQFPAGPGHVVGVPDAAMVAAKACYRWLLWRGIDLAKIEEDRSRAGTAVIVAKVPDEPGKVWFQVEAVPFWPGANGEDWHTGTLDAADAAKVLRDIADRCERYWNAGAVERPDGT